MNPNDACNLDVLIFGGGGAGLWLLDELHRRSYRILIVEAAALGAGQTIASQGIIHGGLKYTLNGLISESARAIREMPALWRDCLAGRRRPNLSNTHVRAQSCALWRTESLRSRLGLLGAQAGLRVAPARVSQHERPPILADCPGDVFRIEEQVLAPRSFLADLAGQHPGRILSVVRDALEFVLRPDSDTPTVRFQNADHETLTCRPATIVFAAGEGNAALRERAGLPTGLMQRRPLHMVLVRGDLPALSGHCVDGLRTRVTITSDVDRQDRTVWQVGGQVAEDGVDRSERELLQHARGELRACIPGRSFDGLEWAAHRVDRAEGKTAAGGRPETETVLREGNVITAWPTKLALVPRLAERVCELLGPPRSGLAPLPEQLDRWPRPPVAQPPWEVQRTWHTDV